MTNDTRRWEQVRDLYLDALERPEAERIPFVQARAEDADVAREVAEMLDASEDERALALEERFVTDVAAEAEPTVDRAGERLGRYRLRERLGHGGMGDVYVADRDDGEFEQSVALKLLRGHRGTADAIARFQNERLILARLDHPHIAGLLDGGVTDDGQPYFVMPLIEGAPITDYRDRQRLPVRRRLRIFREVCDAVQYAHRSLVVHRDLKPSNILVTEHGDVKLLDFGIAKLLEEGASLPGVTRTGELLLTPEYAAPEQLAGEPITTATDVYGLGLLLYELLTGQAPHARRGKSRRQIEDLVTRNPPLPPTRAVTESDAVAAARRTAPANLRRALRGDLETILLRALDPLPERRYPSVAALSEDVARHLGNLPILARPDTWRYRASKFVQRHRTAVASSAAVLVTLAVAGTLTLRQAEQVRQERDRSERVVELLAGVFQRTNPVDPAAEDTLRVPEFLERAETRLLSALDEDPLVSAQMKHVLGGIHSARGDYPRGLALLSEARDEHVAAGGPAERLGPILLDLARADVQLSGLGAAPRVREALDFARETHGPRHPDVASALVLLANVTPESEEKLSLSREALAMQRELLPAVHTDIAATLNHIATIHFQRQELDEAAEFFQASLDLLDQLHDEDHPYTLTTMANLASVHALRLDWDPAESLTRDVLRAYTERLGPRAPQVANAWNSLAVIQGGRRRYPEARAAVREAISIHEETHGAESALVANELRNLAWLHVFDDQHQESAAVFDRAVATHTAHDGPDSPGTLGVRVHRASVWIALGRVEEARRELESARASLTPHGESRELADASVALGRIHLLRGESSAAADAFAAALAFREPRLGPDHGWTAEARAGLERARGEWTARDASPGEAVRIYSEFAYADPHWLRTLLAED